MTLALAMSLGYDTRSTGTKNKNKKWDYIKLESSTQQRELSAERKGNLETKRMYFQTMYPIRS